MMSVYDIAKSRGIHPDNLGRMFEFTDGTRTQLVSVRYSDTSVEVGFKCFKHGFNLNVTNALSGIRMLPQEESFGAV